MSTLPYIEALSDPDLMRLAQQGHQSAFEGLVLRHQCSLVNFFRGMGVYNDAEDMAQDTFVRLFKYRHRYKPSAKFTTFLYLLARQVRIDALRAGKRRKDFEQTLVARQRVDETLGRSTNRHVPDIENLLSALTPAMREVVVLNVYQGLTYEEMAQTLNIPLGTVKSRLFNAMSKLRSTLKGQA